MKKFLLALNMGLTVFSGVKATAQSLEQSAAVDFSKVNAVIEKVIQNSVRYDNIIKKVELKFNPKSDLDTGKLGAQISAEVGTTPWAPLSDSKLGLEVGTHFQNLQTENKEGFIKFGAFLKTQTFAFVRFIAGQALKYEVRDQTEKEILTQLSLVENLNQILAVLPTIKQHLIDKSSDEKDKDYFRSMLFTVKTVGEDVEYIKIEITKPITVNFFTNFVIKTPTLKLENTKIHAAATIVTLVKNTEFQRYLDEARKFLTSLQDENSEFTKEVEMSVKGYIEVVRDFLASHK